MVVFKDMDRKLQWLGRTEGLFLDQGMAQYNYNLPASNELLIPEKAFLASQKLLIHALPSRYFEEKKHQNKSYMIHKGGSCYPLR